VPELRPDVAIPADRPIRPKPIEEPIGGQILPVDRRAFGPEQGGPEATTPRLFQSVPAEGAGPTRGPAVHDVADEAVRGGGADRGNALASAGGWPPRAAAQPHPGPAEGRGEGGQRPVDLNRGGSAAARTGDDPGASIRAPGSVRLPQSVQGKADDGGEREEGPGHGFSRRASRRSRPRPRAPPRGSSPRPGGRPPGFAAGGGGPPPERRRGSRDARAGPAPAGR